MPRFVISILGLLIGVSVFNLSNRLAAPWNELGAVVLYALLAVGAWFYGKDDKFVRGVAIAIGIWALIRLVLALM
ncbi:hypothetical protein [Deinococcus roseus]|uniref:hypothetical protein n=1 Tax=Deinococcus roseus TaxID=392414 RepID=UPI001669D3C4|nr:hypothetical protein [Deinococcus roseus]